MNRLMYRLSISAAWVCAHALVAAPVQAQQKDGDLWEVTSEMQMAGMPQGMQMPGGGPRNVCVKRNDQRPPVADGERCEMYDQKRTGSSYSWKMRCAGSPPTTGSGDITYEGRDRYRGTIQMDHGGQAMTMKLTGRRVGECDATAQQAQVQQQVAAAQRQSDQAMEQMCIGAVTQMTSTYLKPDSPYKCGAKYKTEFCTKLQSQEGFALVASRKRSQGMPAGMPIGDLQEGAEFCNVSGDDIRERLCRRAEQQESLDFLGNSCVGQGQPGYGSAIIARECAGRTFSSPPAEKYRGFCGAVARHGLMQPTADSGKKGAQPAKAAEAKPAEQKPEDNPVEAGKRLLKGIFGR